MHSWPFPQSTIIKHHLQLVFPHHAPPSTISSPIIAINHHFSDFYPPGPPPIQVPTPVVPSSLPRPFAPCCSGSAASPQSWTAFALQPTALGRRPSSGTSHCCRCSAPWRCRGVTECHGELLSELFYSRFFMISYWCGWLCDFLWWLTSIIVILQNRYIKISLIHVTYFNRLYRFGCRKRLREWEWP